MFCNKCGTQQPDNVQFCNNCGSPMTPSQPGMPTPAGARPSGGNNTIIVIAGAAVAVVVAITVFLVFMGKNSNDKNTASGVAGPTAQQQSAQPAAQTTPPTTPAPQQQPPLQPPPTQQEPNFGGDTLGQVSRVIHNGQYLRNAGLGLGSGSLSAQNWKIARNAVYARHGRTFKTKWLDDYFYISNGHIYHKNPGYSDSMLTAADKDNIAYIQVMEKGGSAPPAAATPPPVAGETLDSVVNVVVSGSNLRYSGLGLTRGSLTKAQWRIARNAVYARHGRSFKSNDLHNYFYVQRSYMFAINSGYHDGMLTATDKANISYIKGME